ncbi:bidirectional sugar transporter SWEET5-like [Cornus florida]|uniref:bidirectional sugar transporter SWEET5-like n=1 Tax=Cornus florida TaxID=4283 RepID=UPI0028A04C62|nr:bidirectional sugar transporter SWEET5-like [Cornus florida]
MKNEIAIVDILLSWECHFWTAFSFSNVSTLPVSYMCIIVTVISIVNQKNLQQYNPHFYLATALNSGEVQPNNLVLIINAVGLCLVLLYSVPFLIFGTHILMRKIILCLVIEGTFAGIISLIAFLALDRENRITFVGVVCCIFSSIMYCSPIITVMNVIKDEIVEGMPILPPVIGCATAVVWLIFSALVPKRDWFILPPSSILSTKFKIVGGIVVTYRFLALLALLLALGRSLSMQSITQPEPGTGTGAGAGEGPRAGAGVQTGDAQV